MRVHWPFDELHRIFQPALAADQFAHRSALGAMRAAIDRQIPARLLANPHAVSDFSRDRAADRAVRANVFADCRARGERAGGGRFRFANGRKRHCAENREAARAYSGAAQKSAAIESGGLSGEACKRAAARLTIWFS